jgi:anthranilate synthase
VTYLTLGGIRIRRSIESTAYAEATDALIEALDTRRGTFLSSGIEYPGRYARWAVGFVDPPIEISASQRAVRIRALNERGTVLLAAITDTVKRLDGVSVCATDATELEAQIAEATERVAEEMRSRQPSVFSVLRAMIQQLGSGEERHLGLYGAFGYDLAFQFEPLRLRLPRDPSHRDLVLYLPDEIVVADPVRRTAEIHRYDFDWAGRSTCGMARTGDRVPYAAAATPPPAIDELRDYPDVVRRAREAFHRGDLFETVPGVTFREPCAAPPSEIFRRLQARNPAPYAFLANLGDGEHLVGASPEMYVRVTGRRVETCPISGTIARGRDAIEDHDQIMKLLNSDKDAAELTMCTDVDRNDKARICEPGSVRVIGRRQIELYSRVIHTVDHVEGRLRDGYDALDAFLSHTWAVTVTGAPKHWAMQFIEDHEASPRRWYGGAVGVLRFDGDIDTGLTLRTIQVRGGVALLRVGATLLYDSDPEGETEEIRMKAAAFLDALRRPGTTAAAPAAAPPLPAARGRRVLLVDHEDSFVHTLADYFRQTGADVLTLRTGFPPSAVREIAPDLVVLSPGPGRPSDFRVAETVGLALRHGVPIFGVCLGLQGIVEHFGGGLGVLPTPVHGKASTIIVRGGRLFAGLPERFTAGRYHSLYALKTALSGVLQITAESDDGVVMAVEHRSLPVAAVQFHPESIMSLHGTVGRRLIDNVISVLVPRRAIRPARRAA